jgi:hypothetical protein
MMENKVEIAQPKHGTEHRRDAILTLTAMRGRNLTVR